MHIYLNASIPPLSLSLFLFKQGPSRYSRVDMIMVLFARACQPPSFDLCKTPLLLTIYSKPPDYISYSANAGILFTWD